MKFLRLLSLVFLCSFIPERAFAQQLSADKLVESQRKALLPLKVMDGVWRGNGWAISPNGKKSEFVQTERVGTMLDGVVKVVEGRGYNADGEVVFNAFGTIAYDAMKKELSMRSYAHGRVGDFGLKLTETGYTWDIPAGPMTIHYVAQIIDGKWTEYGERIVPNQEPVRFFEMTLKRVGDTNWPAANAIPFEANGSSSD